MGAQSDLKSWLVPKTGKLFVWDTFLDQESESDPSSIGRALAAGLNLRKHLDTPEVEAAAPLSIMNGLPVAATVLPLFHGEKMYIILGGASDLGLHMSMWMYKVSAFSTLF